MKTYAIGLIITSILYLCSFTYPDQIHTVIDFNNDGISDYAIIDWDGDGNLDYFEATGTVWRVVYGKTSYFNRNELDMSTITKVATGPPLHKLTFYDFDGDGKTDVHAKFGNCDCGISYRTTGKWQKTTHKCPCETTCPGRNTNWSWEPIP